MAAVYPKLRSGLISKEQIQSGFSLQEGFRSWLISQGKSERTVKSYAVTSINAADAIFSQESGVRFSFYYQTSLNEIKQASEFLMSSQSWQEKNRIGNDMYSAGLRRFIDYAEIVLSKVELPKPFILLAGISGTGKTRYVRKQAAASAAGKDNYCHVAVRPDWHEPSDLLGYTSRIGKDGDRYICTDVLAFIARAWKEAAAGAEENKLIPKTECVPFWLCLDEMNLAPVEQYFADFLSILETRKWENDEYECYPLLKPDVFEALDEQGKQDLRKNLGLMAEEYEFIWQSFQCRGISIPPNLIVAGTVNMDETTHGFSRKVIDRALTIDFGEFFPNEYDTFLTPEKQNQPKILTYSRLTQVGADDVAEVTADPSGDRSVSFLKSVNNLLKQTPFELAYRALNELLLSVACFKPETEEELKAVWDDFLMMKVLPRIEGDADKLATGNDEETLLEKFKALLEGEHRFGAAAERPELLSEAADKAVLHTRFRSLKKLDWMQSRLERQGFTAFWP